MLQDLMKFVLDDPNFDKEMLNIEKSVYFETYGAGEKRWLGGRWRCMHPACTENAIRSHTIGRANGLGALVESGGNSGSRVVAGPQFFPKIGDKIGANISQTNASVFPGFCNAHDTSIFLHLDRLEGAFDQQALFLQCSRSFCREYRVHHHQFEMGKAAFDNIISRQHKFIAGRVEEISGMSLDMIPGFRAGAQFNCNRDKFDTLRMHAKAQFEFLSKFDPILRSIESYISGRVDRPELSIFRWDCIPLLDFAMSGVDDIGTFESPVPMFYFAVSTRQFSHLVLFCHIEHEDHVKKLIMEKGVGDLVAGSDGTSLFRFFEQLLIDRTNHWFVRPSALNSLSSDAREALENDVNFDKRSIYSSRPPVFPTPKGLSITESIKWSSLRVS